MFCVKLYVHSLVDKFKCVISVFEVSQQHSDKVFLGKQSRQVNNKFIKLFIIPLTRLCVREDYRSVCVSVFNLTVTNYVGWLISNAHSKISRKRNHVFKQTKVGSKVQYFSYKLTYLFFAIVALSFNTFFPT